MKFVVSKTDYFHSTAIPLNYLAIHGIFDYIYISGVDTEVSPLHLLYDDMLIVINAIDPE